VSGNWGVEQGHISVNPVKAMKKPEAANRELLITQEIHKDILKRVSKCFGELLELAWETGARPFELYRLETRHLELKNHKAVYPKAEAKGKKKPRVIYFSAKAMKIIKRNMQPAGPVMRNDDGKAWTIYAINCAFLRLQAAMGREVSPDIEIPEKMLKTKMEMIRKIRAKKAAEKKENEEKPMRVLTEAELKRQARKSLEDSAARKNAPKFCLYAYRHSFAHRKLTEGVDSMVVATWLGHKDTTMLMRIYGHIHKNQDFLLAQLNK
jgi:integrase